MTARKKVVNGMKLKGLYSKTDRAKRDFEYLKIR